MEQPQLQRPATERPSYKLTMELLSTYKLINELFYEAKRKRQAMEKAGDKKAIFNDGYDDDSGNYIVQIGEEIAGRYIVEEVLGKGSFGIVVKAHDHVRDECVAVKIIKNKVQFFHQAKVEMEILTKLNSAASDEHNVVKLKKVFSWKEHLCLVFELLSFNLYDLLKYTKFNGVSLSLIRKFACQILKTLDFLSSPAIRVIHCDLKPENILLKNPKRSGVKVIDFGSSCFLHKKMFKYIQSRFYRSPEVIWGLNYDCAIDIWSLACILVEMHTGLPLFDGKNEAEQLLKFHEILGPPPQALVELSPKRQKLYNYVNKSWVLLQCKGVAPAQKMTLEQILGVYTGGPNGRRKGQQGHTEQDYLNFLDLIKKMLNYNPKQRITPAVALQHPFLVMPEEATPGVTAPTPTPTNRDVAASSSSSTAASDQPAQPPAWAPPVVGPAPEEFVGPPPLQPPIAPPTHPHAPLALADMQAAVPPLLSQAMIGTPIMAQPDVAQMSQLLTTMQSMQQLWQLPPMPSMQNIQQMHLAQQQYLAILAQQAQHLQQQQHVPLGQAVHSPPPALPSKPPSSHSSTSSGPNAGAAPMHRDGTEKANSSQPTISSKRVGSVSPTGQERLVS
eukprot:EG_transcript_1885